jgi:hypothetical protein
MLELLLLAVWHEGLAAAIGANRSRINYYKRQPVQIVWRFEPL